MKSLFRMSVNPHWEMSSLSLALVGVLLNALILVKEPSNIDKLKDTANTREALNQK